MCALWNDPEFKINESGRVFKDLSSTDFDFTYKVTVFSAYQYCVVCRNVLNC